MKCKNCGNVANESYCPYCAQKTKVDRITFKSLLEEFSDTIFQVNKGFLYTVKELFIRPGHTIREYLDGKRKNHFKPIAFVFTLSTIYFLLSRYVDFDTLLGYLAEGFSAADADISKESPDYEESKKMAGILNWMANNYAYASLLLLPLYALASYLSFLGLRYNYLEHIAVNAYVTGQQAIIYIVFFALFLLIDVYYLEAIPVLISMGYTFWVFRQLFNNLSTSSFILRTILTYIFCAVFTFGFMFIFSLISMIFRMVS